jgi:hypothetical protein
MALNCPMTIGDLMRQGYCRKPGCGHGRAVALAPFAIRYGLDYFRPDSRAGEVRGLRLGWRFDRRANSSGVIDRPML